MEETESSCSLMIFCEAGKHVICTLSAQIRMTSLWKWNMIIIRWKCAFTF